MKRTFVRMHSRWWLRGAHKVHTAADNARRSLEPAAWNNPQAACNLEISRDLLVNECSTTIWGK